MPKIPQKDREDAQFALGILAARIHKDTAYADLALLLKDYERERQLTPDQLHVATAKGLADLTHILLLELVKATDKEPELLLQELALYIESL